jgi:hypothetical protein
VEKKLIGEKTSEGIKWLKGTKHEDYKDIVVIWIAQVNVKYKTVTDEVLKNKQSI